MPGWPVPIPELAEIAELQGLPDPQHQPRLDRPHDR